MTEGREPSAHETLYLSHLTAAGINGWTREHAFAMHLGRRFRFDFAFPAEMIAVELQGGTWVKGGHGQGMHAEKDCEKATFAALLGWRVMTFTARQVRSGWALLATEVALARKPRSVLMGAAVQVMAQTTKRQRFV
jgi:very-short-patch-repair endonuclease